ncbi:MAG: hypothetical protein R2795_04985 [Saprospiraceae bacterium]
MEVFHQYDLSPYNTFGLTSVAEYFATLHAPDDWAKALAAWPAVLPKSGYWVAAATSSSLPCLA